MTWTSRSAPESRITRRITEPWVELCEPGAARRTEDDLRRAQPAGRFDERLADVVAHDLPVRPSEAFHERPLARERIAGGRREAVLGRDVHGDEVSLYALCHARGTTDEPSPSAAPVSATSTRSRVSQGRSMP